MPEAGGESPQKYVYKLKFDPKEPKKSGFGEVDQEELQNCVDRLLGVQHAKDPEAGKY